MSKLNDFLEAQSIDPRRVLAASKKAEALTGEDRQIRLARHRARSGKPTDAEKSLAGKKPRDRASRSRRPPWSVPFAARRCPGAAKTRITRAVNAVLTTKKKDAVSLRDLF